MRRFFLLLAVLLALLIPVESFASPFMVLPKRGSAWSASYTVIDNMDYASQEAVDAAYTESDTTYYTVGVDTDEGPVNGRSMLIHAASGGAAVNDTIFRVLDTTVDLTGKNTLEYWIKSTRTGANNRVAVFNYATPQMTANDAPSGTASASSELNSGNAAYKAFDRGADPWHSAATGPTFHLTYQFESSLIVSSYFMVARTDDPVNLWSPTDFKLRGSSNGSDYTDFTAHTSVSWTTGQKRLYPLENTSSYAYYDLYITSATGNGGIGGGCAYCAIREHGLLQTIASTTPTIASANVWQKVEIDISGIADASKSRVVVVMIQNTNNDSEEYINIGGLQAK